MTTNLAAYQSMKRPGPPACKFIDLLDDETLIQLAVASTGVVYGKSFIPPKNCTFGMIGKFSSPGVVNVKIELESGILLPTTEGSADTLWAVGDLVVTVTATTAFATVAAPVVAPYCRLKLTGLGSNDAGTILTNCAFTFEKNF